MRGSSSLTVTVRGTGIQLIWQKLSVRVRPQKGFASDPPLRDDAERQQWQREFEDGAPKAYGCFVSLSPVLQIMFPCRASYRTSLHVHPATLLR